MHYSMMKCLTLVKKKWNASKFDHVITCTFRMRKMIVFV
jgi:hypothetical protein